MKKFLKKALIFIIPIIVFVIMVNYFVDPANLFSDDFEEELAEILHSDYNAAGVYNYDERLFQKKYIEKSNEKKEILVLGSSRSLQIRSDIFENDNFFNHGVSGAVLEDYLAITEIYNQNKGLADKIILGLNPWIFNKYNIEERWRSIEKYYYSFMGERNELPLIEKIMSSNYNQLISANYFQASFEMLISGQAFKKIKATDQGLFNVPVKLADGSLVYQEPRKKISVEDAEIEAQNYIRNGVYSLENYHELDPDYIDIFEKLISFYQDNEAEIVFYLPPYHPLVFDFLNENQKYQMVFEAEEYIKKFAEKNNIKVVGNYNPYKLNLDRDDFHDGMHPRENVMEKLFINDY